MRIDLATPDPEIPRDMAQTVEHQPRSRAGWPATSVVQSQADQPPAIMTREGERALRARVERLRHQLEVDFAGRLSEARGFGEIEGNDDYLQTLEEQAVLASRLSRLQSLLNSATVVEQPAVSEVAAVGTAVEVEDLSSGAIHEHRLVGDYESPGADAASASSPVGRALIGHSRGDEVEVKLPHGRIQTLRVLGVRSAA
jgi:transcription elongation factor GreA